MAWAKNGTPDTLTSSGDDMTISDVTDLKFQMYMCYMIASSTIDPHMRFNSDTGSNYAYRYNDNGGTDGTGTSAAIMLHGTGNSTTPQFAITYCINISSEEKLIINFAIGQNTAGAGTAPNRRESVSKHAQTSNPITAVNSHNSGAGSYDTDSNLSALGTN